MVTEGDHRQQRQTRKHAKTQDMTNQRSTDSERSVKYFTGGLSLFFTCRSKHLTEN